MPFATDQEKALTSLLVSVMNAREQDGARVSRMLHDDVGQVLSAIGLHLDLLRMDQAENQAAAAGRITEIQHMLETAIGRVRDLSYELNPSVVERAGLQAALERLTCRYRPECKASIRLSYDPAARVPAAIAAAMYKIAEQALDNAVRHSGACNIDIHVTNAKAGLSLAVRDDGSGFLRKGPRGEAPGLGVHLMRHYAAVAGLRFSLASAPGKGTIVKAIRKVSAPAG